MENSSPLQVDRFQSGICEIELSERHKNRVISVDFMLLFLNFQGAKVHNLLD